MSGSPEEDLIAQAKSVDVGGVAVEIVRKGKGAPLLFLHGMDGIEGAAAMIDALAGGFDVIAPSHPGFGASVLPRGVSTVDDLGYFYLDLMDQLALKDVVVAGFSFGGWVALEMLVKDCARASRLVLGAPFGLPTGDRRQQIVADIFMLNPRDAQAKLQAGAPPAKRDAASDPLLERGVRNADAVSLYGWSPYMHNPKLRQRLHRVKTPALVLWGEQDEIAPLDHGKAYAAALPNATFTAIPKAGHRLYADKPDVAARHIRKFVEAAASAAA